MTWIASNSNNNAFQAWQKDKQERSVIASSPSKAVQSGVSFKRASRAMNTNYASGLLNSKSAGKGGKSYKWETDNLYKLPRSYGRSYDEKFNNYAKKVLGIDSAEADRFRKFLDAKEKGQLTSDMMSNTTKAMNDAFARAKLSKSEKQDEAPIVPHTRGRLEKVMDALLIGNRASANAVDYKLNGKSFWQGAWDGVKTSAPWEIENTDKNRITYADVLKKDYVDKAPGNASKLRDIVGSGFFGATGYGASKLIGAMGGKGEQVANKLALSGGGLALDIAGDPTTYASGGLSALVKGTGKGILRQAGKVMTEDVARNIVEKHASTTGKVLSETELTSEAKKLFDKYHSVLGTNRTAENIRVGLGKASVPIPGSAKVLQHVGDYTVAPAYNTARKMIYGSQIGKLFSTKANLYSLAKTNPAELYNSIEHLVTTQGAKADKIASEQAFRDYAKKNLTNLTPADQAKIIELMQDKTIATKVKRMVDIKGMSEARVLKRQMAKDAETMKNTLDTADAHRTTIEQMQTENFGQLNKAKQVMDDAEKEYVDNVASLKFDQNMSEQDMARAIDHVRNASKTLDAKYEGMSVPLKPAEVPDKVSTPHDVVNEYYHHVKGEKPVVTENKKQFAHDVVELDPKRDMTIDELKKAYNLDYEPTTLSHGLNAYSKEFGDGENTLNHIEQKLDSLIKDKPQISVSTADKRVGTVGVDFENAKPDVVFSRDMMTKIDAKSNKRYFEWKNWQSEGDAPNLERDAKYWKVHTDKKVTSSAEAVHTPDKPASLWIKHDGNKNFEKELSAVKYLSEKHGIPYKIVDVDESSDLYKSMIEHNKTLGDKPKRPYIKNPKEPTLDTVEPPVYPAEPKIGDFVDPSIKELQFNASGTLKDWNDLKQSAPKNDKGEPLLNNQDIMEKAGQFSQLIFGKSDSISPAIYPNALDQIEKMIQEGWDKHHIIDYIHSHAHQYDGRAVDIDRFVADKFNYGSGLKEYKNWKEFYTDRVEEIYKRAEKNGGNVLDSDKSLLNDLEQTKLERSMLRAKMMDMSKSELLDFRKTEANKRYGR
jgi:hypothetical protein